MSSSKAEQASHFPTTTESSGDLKNLPRKLMSPDIPQSHQDSSRTPSFISTNPEGNESGQIPSLMEEIRALKARILEIEGRNENPRSNSKIEQRPPGLIEDMEKYRRMEKCLYSHRKEWESQDTTKNLDMVPDQDNSRPGEGNGPWKIHWNIVHNPGDYKRPDPFDPLHDCHITGDTNLDQGGMDDFDETIDYGNRRDRLRKAFEWEMDRLYLSEETSIRRRKQAQQAKEKLPSSGFAGTSSGSNRHQAPLVRSVDWNSFKKLGEYQQMSLCAIDILIEEPVIQEDWRISGFQVGFRRRRNHQKDRQALNAIMSAQLPERIRISSDAIPVILNKILEPSAENWIRSGGEPVVFTRPFKSLTYCEQGLRNLQKKLENRIARETIPEDSNTSPNMVDMYNEQEQRQDPSVRVALEPQRPPSERNKADEQVKQLQSDDSSESEISDHEDENGLREHDLDMITKLRQPVQQLAFFLDTLKRKVLHRCEYLNSTHCRRIFFSDLWHLFRPGMEIIRRDGEQAYRVLHVTSANHRMISPWQRWTDPPYNPDGETKEPRPDFRITCIYVDVDGQHIGPVAKTFDIKPFEGEREATSLEVFPLRLYTVRNGLENEDEWNEELTYTEDSWLRQKLIQRGRRFLDVLRERRWFYAGPTLDDYEEVEGEVIVDFEAAFDVRDEDVSQNKKPQVDGLPNLLLDDYEVGEECRASCCQDEYVYDDTHIDMKQGLQYINNLLPKKGAQETTSLAVLPRDLTDFRRPAGKGESLVSEEELLILSCRVFGFLLRQKRWAELDMEYLSDYRPKETAAQISREPGSGESSDAREQPVLPTAWDRLVIDVRHKQLVLSLITQYFRSKSSGGKDDLSDLVRGKGKGLIMLLHGAPGVGKTSTAEGIAEKFGKPLFQMTSGDLGTSPKEVEHSLERNFALANKWDCILLIDEADVFLAERTKDDLNRSALVSVFLRILEYYSGILFLTTNRVGDFDEAFTSRIHMTLFYPELDKDKTHRVFEVNLKILEEQFSRQGRQLVIDYGGIYLFARQYYDEYPHARWNGRQIHNACRTALALAEFDAQGGSHAVILKSHAVVQLRVAHFDVIRNAHMDFTQYLSDIYRLDANARAMKRMRKTYMRAAIADESLDKPGDNRKNAYDGKGKTPEVKIPTTVSSGLEQQASAFDPPKSPMYSSFDAPFARPSWNHNAFEGPQVQPQPAYGLGEGSQTQQAQSFQYPTFYKQRDGVERQQGPYPSPSYRAGEFQSIPGPSASNPNSMQTLYNSQQQIPIPLEEHRYNAGVPRPSSHATGTGNFLQRSPQVSSVTQPQFPQYQAERPSLVKQVVLDIYVPQNHVEHNQGPLNAVETGRNAGGVGTQLPPMPSPRW